MVVLCARCATHGAGSAVLPVVIYDRQTFDVYSRLIHVVMADKHFPVDVLYHLVTLRAKPVHLGDPACGNVPD